MALLGLFDWAMSFEKLVREEYRGRVLSCKVFPESFEVFLPLSKKLKIDLNVPNDPEHVEMREPGKTVDPYGRAHILHVGGKILYLHHPDFCLSIIDVDFKITVEYRFSEKNYLKMMFTRGKALIELSSTSWLQNIQFIISGSENVEIEYKHTRGTNKLSGRPWVAVSKVIDRETLSEPFRATIEITYEPWRIVVRPQNKKVSLEAASAFTSPAPLCKTLRELMIRRVGSYATCEIILPFHIIPEG